MVIKEEEVKTYQRRLMCDECGSEAKFTGRVIEDYPSGHALDTYSLMHIHQCSGCRKAFLEDCIYPDISYKTISEVTDDNKLKKYEVWQEGYYCSEIEKGLAIKVGEVFASSFRDACNRLCSTDSDYNEERLQIWSCQLYDNEKDARKEFG